MGLFGFIEGIYKIDWILLDCTAYNYIIGFNFLFGLID